MAHPHASKEGHIALDKRSGQWTVRISLGDKCKCYTSPFRQDCERWMENIKAYGDQTNDPEWVKWEIISRGGTNPKQVPDFPFAFLTDEERMTAGCLQGAALIFAIILALLLCALLGSCTTTKYVPVTETHTEHHWHTDTVRQRDSTHTESKTVIRELDSAAMARYGIQMESNQRAWLVLQREMENRLRELEHRSAQCDTVRDSIPVPTPVEVIKEVPAKLTWWQQTRMHVGGIVIFLLIIFAVWKIYVTLHPRK